jgi:hypothetical protein
MSSKSLNSEFCSDSSCLSGCEMLSTRGGTSSYTGGSLVGEFDVIITRSNESEFAYWSKLSPSIYFSEIIQTVRPVPGTIQGEP